MELSLNLSGLHPAVAHSVIKGLQHEDKARHDLGVLEQIRLKRLMDSIVQPGVNNQVGRMNMVMSEGQRAAAMRQYGQLCFADPDLVKFLIKKHPDFAVRDVGTRIQSGYTGRGGLA